MPSGARAATSMASCRVVETRLRMRPAISTSGRKRAKPETSAAIDWPCRAASTTRITGRPSVAARSAVEPCPSAAPSKRPMTPSTSSRSAAAAWLAASVFSRAGDIAQGSRLMASAAGDAREDGAVDIVGPGLGRRHGKAPRRQRRDEAERHEGLAGAGAGGGDDEAVSHRNSPARRRRTNRASRDSG